MAFDTYERSQYHGRPVELYTFRLQGLVQRYVRGDAGVNIGGHDFYPGQISCTELRDTAERAKNEVTIRFDYLRDPNAPRKPSTQPLGALWHPYVPSSPVFVTIQAIHKGDSEEQLQNIWTGKAGQPKFSSTEMELLCVPSRADRKGWSGRARRLQRACPLAVYSQGFRMCNLPLEDWAVELTISDVDGLTIAAPEIERDDDIEWAGGMVEWEDDDGIVQTRTIRSNTALTITLDYGASSLAGLTGVTAWPGCPGNWDACEKRDNTDNYGGCFYMPGKSPFDGNRAV